MKQWKRTEETGETRSGKRSRGKEQQLQSRAKRTRNKEEQTRSEEQREGDRPQAKGKKGRKRGREGEEGHHLEQNEYKKLKEKETTNEKRCSK